jgi:hypothetical protein
MTAAANTKPLQPDGVQLLNEKAHFLPLPRVSRRFRLIRNFSLFFTFLLTNKGIFVKLASTN